MGSFQVCVIIAKVRLPGRTYVRAGTFYKKQALKRSGTRRSVCPPYTVEPRAPNTKSSRASTSRANPGGGAGCSN